MYLAHHELESVIIIIIITPGHHHVTACECKEEPQDPIAHPPE